MFVKATTTSVTRKRPASSDTSFRNAAKFKNETVGSDTPGNPSDPRSFFRPNFSEPRLASYLGFSLISELRIFLLSYPVLDAAIAFKKVHEKDPVAMRHNEFLSFLYTNEAELKHEMHREMMGFNQEVPETKSNAEKGAVIADRRKLAKALLKMEHSINEITSMDVAHNREQYDRARREIQTVFYRQIPDGVEYLPLVLPQLGPLDGEHRLESLNRCSQACRHMYNDLVSPLKIDRLPRWNVRFSSISMIQTQTPIPGSSVPRFMLRNQLPTTQDASVSTDTDSVYYQDASVSTDTGPVDYQDSHVPTALQVSHYQHLSVPPDMGPSVPFDMGPAVPLDMGRVTEHPALPPINMIVIWDPRIPSAHRDFLVHMFVTAPDEVRPKLVHDHPSHDPRLFTVRKQLHQMLRLMYYFPPLIFSPWFIYLEAKGEGMKDFGENLFLVAWEDIMGMFRNVKYTSFKLIVQFDVWAPGCGWDAPPWNSSSLTGLEYHVPSTPPPSDQSQDLLQEAFPYGYTPALAGIPDSSG